MLGAGGGELALHQIHRRDENFLDMYHLIGGAGELAQRDRIRGMRLHACQREMRAERLAVQWHAKGLAPGFDVVVQQLELGIGAHADPYDAWSPKVRECTDSSDLDLDHLVSFADELQRLGESPDHFRRLLAEEFDGEV